MPRRIVVSVDLCHVSWRLLLVACVCVLCAGSARTSQDPGGDMLVVNPHGDPRQCTACHAGQHAPYTAIAGEAVDAVCLTCHDGKIAPAERHPSARRMDVPGIISPEGWPLADGKLTCLTCHDLSGHCQPDGDPLAAGNAFLRGPQPSNVVAFCAACHETPTTQVRFNPHRVFDATGAVEPGSCAVCHVGAQADNVRAPLSSDSSPGALRHPELMLCAGCHTRHVDYFEPGHVGTVMPDDSKQRLAKTKRAINRGLDDPPLRLGEGDRIVCTTCHNPHQQGLFVPGHSWSAGGIVVTSTSRQLMLWGMNEKICRACHNQ